MAILFSQSMLPVDVLCKELKPSHLKFSGIEVGGQLLQKHLYNSLKFHPQYNSLYLPCGIGGTLLSDGIGNANQTSEVVFMSLQMLQAGEKVEVSKRLLHAFVLREQGR